MVDNQEGRFLNNFKHLIEINERLEIRSIYVD